MKITFFSVLFLLVYFTSFAQDAAQNNQNANQQQQQEEVVIENQGPVAIPAMRNVFFNTLWGSLAAGLIQSSLHILDDQKETDVRYSLSEIGVSFFAGATIGGFVGFAVGLILSFNNVTYYDNDMLGKTGVTENSFSPVREFQYAHINNSGGNFNLSQAPQNTAIVYQVPVLKIYF